MKFTKENVPFAMVANEVLTNPDLSFKAKGVYAYLFSKPEGWDFSSVRIKNESKDGTDGVQAALLELEEAGYLLRERKPSGKMVYHLKHSQKPVRDIPLQAISLSGKTPQVSKTDNPSNKEKESKTDSATDLFEIFWKAYPRKTAKHLSLKKWLTLKISPELCEKMVASVELHKKTSQWREVRFVPHAATFLNQRRWEDEVEAALPISRKTIVV